MELLPGEQVILEATLDSRSDPSQRLIYADWLEEQGDPRGEYLRLQHRLLMATDAEKREEWSGRAHELQQGFSESWVEAIRDASIDNCTASPNCPGRWSALNGTGARLEQLEPRGDMGCENVRWCETCFHPVHYCPDTAFAARLTAASEVLDQANPPPITATGVINVHEEKGVVERAIRFIKSVVSRPPMSERNGQLSLTLMAGKVLRNMRQQLREKGLEDLVNPRDADDD